VCENPAVLRVTEAELGAAAPHRSAPKACRAPPVSPCPGRRRRATTATGESTPLADPETGSPWDPQLASLMAARARAVMIERLIVMLITDLKA
jgi:hypothetical protein